MYLRLNSGLCLSWCQEERLKYLGCPVISVVVFLAVLLIFFCSSRSLASLRYAWTSVSLRRALWFRLFDFFFSEVVLFGCEEEDKVDKGGFNGSAEIDEEREDEEADEEKEAVGSLYHWDKEPSHDCSELVDCVAARGQLWSSGKRWFTQTSFSQFLHGKRTCSGTWHPLTWHFFFFFFRFFHCFLLTRFGLHMSIHQNIDIVLISVFNRNPTHWTNGSSHVHNSSSSSTIMFTWEPMI